VTPWAILKPEPEQIDTPSQLEAVEPNDDRSIDDQTPPLIPGRVSGLSQPPTTEESKAFAKAEINRVSRLEKSKDEIMSIKLNTIRASDKDEFVQWQEEIRAMDSSSDESLSVDSTHARTGWLTKTERDFYDQDDYDDIIEQPVGLYWMKGGR
jgi:hypothetical protein